MKQIIENSLQNNMKIIAAQNTNLHSINIAIYFKVGSIYETSKINGITHMCEHMYFRQLNAILQTELYYLMERIGTTMRAKTYADFVCFDITVSPIYFDEALDIISLLLSDFEWTEENFIKELAVVKKQIEFKSKSFTQIVSDNYFSGTKMKMPIMGTVDTVDNLTIKQLNQWKKRFFNTNNAFCVLTGAFSYSNYEKLKQKFELIEKVDTISYDTPSIIPKNFCSRNNRSSIIIDTDWSISDLSITFDVDTDNINPYNADILCSILSQGVGSKLSLVLREREALTDEIYGRIDSFPEYKKIIVEFSVQNQDLERALKLCFDEILNLKNGLLLTDLQSAVVFFTESQKFILDCPSEYNFYLGYNYILYKKVKDLSEDIENYKNVTLLGIKNDCNKIFASSNLSITLTNNKKYYKAHQLKRIINEFRDRLDNVSTQ